MKFYTIANLDLLTPNERKLMTNAVALESGQSLIQITEKNCKVFTAYRKYTGEEVNTMDLGTKVIEEKSQIVYSENAPFAKKSDSNGKKFFKRHGTFSEGNPFFVIEANTSEVIEIEIDFNHVKIEAIEIIGAGKSHAVDLCIVDTEGNVLNQFAYNSCIAEKFYRFSSKYDADLFKGLKVHIEIFNYSNVASNVGVNLELNEVV